MSNRILIVGGGWPGLLISRVRINTVGAPVLRSLQGWEQPKHTARAFELTCPQSSQFPISKLFRFPQPYVTSNLD
jgi:hypothetical protein